MVAVAGLPKSRWLVIVVRAQREESLVVLLVDDIVRCWTGVEMVRARCS